MASLRFKRAMIERAAIDDKIGAKRARKATEFGALAEKLNTLTAWEDAATFAREARDFYWVSANAPGVSEFASMRFTALSNGWDRQYEHCLQTIGSNSWRKG